MIIASYAFTDWTDDELYEYWQERIAIRFEDGREESIDQVKHMEAKALMAQLGRPLPTSIRNEANRWRNVSRYSGDTRVSQLH